MKITKEWINLVFTGILACCALVITGLVVQETLIKQTPGENQPIRIENWNKITVSTKILGNPDAPVRILEFFDYQCPFCKQVNPTIRQLLQSYKNKIYVQLVHFPLNIHPKAYQAAIAAECAANQDIFERYHHLIFTYQEDLDNHTWSDIAIESQIPNLQKFNRCIRWRMTEPRVKEGISLADVLGITSIPTFMVNDQLISGAISEEQFDRLIEQALLETNEM